MRIPPINVEITQLNNANVYKRTKPSSTSSLAMSSICVHTSLLDHHFENLSISRSRAWNTQYREYEAILWLPVWAGSRCDVDYWFDIKKTVLSTQV